MNLIEIIADAGFYVQRETGVTFDEACNLCRAAVGDALANGIDFFDATALADVVIDAYA